MEHHTEKDQIIHVFVSLNCERVWVYVAHKSNPNFTHFDTHDHERHSQIKCHSFHKWRSSCLTLGGFHFVRYNHCYLVESEGSEELSLIFAECKNTRSIVEETIFKCHHSIDCHGSIKITSIPQNNIRINKMENKPNT